jgi:periplasmic divalent cation tolerance protein
MANSQESTSQAFLKKSSLGVSLFYVPCPDRATAESLSLLLLRERLAACTNLIPGMTSQYWWQGKIETAQEVILLIKTESRLKNQIHSRLREVHPYQVPCLMEIPITSLNSDYLSWLKSEIHGGSL